MSEKTHNNEEEEQNPKEEMLREMEFIETVYEISTTYYAPSRKLVTTIKFEDELVMKDRDKLDSKFKILDEEFNDTWREDDYGITFYLE